MARAPVSSIPSDADPTYYPVTEKMGEGILQRWIAELLRPLLERFLLSRGETVFVGADQFIYWEQYAPTRSIAPDIYVLPGVPSDTQVDCWKTWETGITPSFALEIVGRDWIKDYEDSPRRYDHLGVRELVVFDPQCHKNPERVRWRVYRRLAKHGLVCTGATQEDRVRSRVLRCWLREVGKSTKLRLRIATGAHGEELFPTETERAQTETERAQREFETRKAGEVEIARLRAEIERLKR